MTLLKGILVTTSAICFSMAAANLGAAIFPSRADVAGLLGGLTYFPMWDLIYKLTTKKPSNERPL